MDKKLKILITTGIYPPKIGGPAQYAKNLQEAFNKKGCVVRVKTFGLENYLPTGVRHAFFFIKIIPQVIASDFILTLDTFSVGFPSVVAARLFNKSVIIRTGGDFLWEQYVERTGHKVLFRNFYTESRANWSWKEKLIFTLTRFTLVHADRVVFSTTWQRDIFAKAYGLDETKISIIENYYGPKEPHPSPDLAHKTFLASTRALKWKNVDTLQHVFHNKDSKIPADVQLFTSHLTFSNFMDKMGSCYAVILVSLGDISPNMILDAIRHNKPFICTQEVGIMDRIKDIGIFVDPLNKEEIESAVLKLLDPTEYDSWVEKVKGFDFSHTWDEIANEFLDLIRG